MVKFATIMPKELLLYSGLYDYSVESLITQINDVMDEAVTMRINSPGGNLFASWGLFAKVKEHGEITMKVDGLAASAAGCLTLYAKYVECLSVSRFMLHRADGYVSTDQEKELLNSINADLRKQMEARFDAAKFKKITGYSIDDMFNPETRVNVWLTASQAKKIGLVNKVTELKPEQEAAMAEATTEFAMRIAATLEEPTTKEKSKPSDMTIEKLKAEFPAVYASIVEAAKKAGQEAEQARVKGWLAWAKVDAEAVQKGIAEGKEVTMEVVSEMSAKAASVKALKNAEDDSAAGVQTDEPETGKVDDPKIKASAKELVAFMADVDKHLGRKKAVA